MCPGLPTGPEGRATPTDGTWLLGPHPTCSHLREPPRGTPRSGGCLLRGVAGCYLARPRLGLAEHPKPHLPSGQRRWDLFSAAQLRPAAQPQDGALPRGSGGQPPAPSPVTCLAACAEGRPCTLVSPTPAASTEARRGYVTTVTPVAGSLVAQPAGPQSRPAGLRRGPGLTPWPTEGEGPGVLLHSGPWAQAAGEVTASRVSLTLASWRVSAQVSPQLVQ